MNLIDYLRHIKEIKEVEEKNENEEDESAIDSAINKKLKLNELIKDIDYKFKNNKFYKI